MTDSPETRRLALSVLGQGSYWEGVVDRLDRAGLLRADATPPAAAAEDLGSLRSFTAWCMEAAWSGRDISGGDLQDKAAELGLIQLRPIPPERAIDGETEHYVLAWADDAIGEARKTG